MNFNILEINKWYETEAGKINGNLVTCFINTIIKDKLDKNILYIGPDNIIKKIMQDNFMGKDGFQWFVGVVEDRQDPQKLGRVRVRCLG